MTKLIMFRHGKRLSNTGEYSGDGPLANFGRRQVAVSVDDLIYNELKLPEKSHFKIDRAIVAGSVSGAETFGIIWDRFLSAGIRIVRYDLRKEYFSTVDEDWQWAELYEKIADEIMLQKSKHGEKYAILKYARHLISPCADRILAAIDAAACGGKKNILLVTQAPHDTLIEDALLGTPQNNECLELGAHKIIDF